jgi:hypothetical protein
MLCGLPLVQQAAIGNCLSFDPFPFDKKGHLFTLHKKGTQNQCIKEAGRAGNRVWVQLGYNAKADIMPDMSSHCSI